MVRGLLCFGGVFVALLAALAIILQKTGVVDVVGLLRPLPRVDESYQRGFRSDAMAKINQIRVAGLVDAVEGDEEMQSYLADFVSSQEDPVDMDLQVVFNALQSEFPGAQYLAANLITSDNREDLLRKIAGWDAVANSDFDVINTAVFTKGRTMGALGVMSRRIPAFSLGLANTRGGKFYNQCPHCKEIHALEVEKESRTLILSCPYCDLPFDVLASDTGGRIRRASDFFEGFELPEDPAESRNQTPEERIVSLWNRIADRCEYELDQEHSETREVWKSPAETWGERAGDCEDTAILLADALISAGFEARVAIGWNGNIGQHAWVVVKTGENQYVLESTLQDGIVLENLTPVKDAADFYQPEQLFDRDHLYFTSAKPEQFRLDYFSARWWKGIPVKKEAPGRPKLSLR
jgi:hypothetical protein